MTEHHLQIQDWKFAAVAREKGRFGPDVRVSKGAENATVWLDENGFHSDNKALMGVMPPQVNDAYEAYLIGAVDGHEESKRRQVAGGEEWRETGNHIAHSAQESSGWRIKSMVNDTNPPAFKVQVKAADGHVTDYAFDAQSEIATNSTDKRNPLPESVQAIAEAMLAGQRDGAEVAKHRPRSLVEREEARRHAASSAEHGR